MARVLCLGMLLSITFGWAQPVEGPRTLLDGSNFISPRFGVSGDGIVRVVWNEGGYNLYTLLYDWNTDTVVESSHVVYTAVGGHPLPRDILCVSSSDWEVVIEEMTQNWWQLPLRLMILVSSAQGIQVDTVAASDDVVTPESPFTQFKAWQLCERPGGGRIVFMSEQEAVFGEDFFLATDYPGAAFLDSMYNVENITISGLGNGYLPAEPVGHTVVSRDSVVYVLTSDFDTTELVQISASGQWSGPIILDCPRQWACALAYTSADELILFSSSGTFRVQGDTGCDSLGNAGFEIFSPFDVDNQLGAAVVSGPTSANYITLYRSNVDGTRPAPIGAVQVVGNPPETRQYEAVAIHDGVVYVLWTFGPSWNPIGIGMFRVGWSDTILVSVADIPVVPKQFSLSAYPNPFNSELQIQYELPRSVDAEIVVFNVLGQKVAGLVSGMQSAGSHQAVWSPQEGSGIYFVTLRTADAVRTEKVLLAR